MGDSGLTKQQQSGEVVDAPDLPGPVEVPIYLDADLVKSVYNTFCDQCVKAGMDGPPRWT